MNLDPTIAPLPPAGNLLADGGRRPVLSALGDGIGRHEFGLDNALQRTSSKFADRHPRVRRLRKSADESSLFHAPNLDVESPHVARRQGPDYPARNG